MRFSCAAVAALCAIVATSSSSRSCDALVVPTTRSVAGGFKTSSPGGSWDNDNFLGRLSSSVLLSMSDGSEQSKHEDDEEEENDPDEPASGSSRFKEMMAAAKSVEGGGGGLGFGGRAIENPFLSQPYSSPLTNPSPSSNIDEMSVEEQARRFREMMEQQQQGGGVGGVVQPPPVKRVAQTDRAGRPVGRNRDADTIANTADLYFAQLKRDSTVRTMARIRGEDEVAESVFEDEGVKQLENLLVENPYLKGQQEKERALIDTIPEEAIRQYLDGKEVTDEEKTSAGISYRQKLMERRQKSLGAQPQTTTATPPPPPPPSPPQQVQQQVSTPQPQQLQSPPPSPPQSQPVSTPQNAQLSPDESRQKIRTLMGMLLKHRGGPGFGKGRLKGPEIQRFSDLLEEVTNMLRDEAQIGSVSNDSVSTVPASPVQQQAPVAAPPAPAAPAAPVPPPPAAAAPVAAAAPSSVDSMLACIDGAITMYKNSPPQLKGSVLFTLRAALASAVETCDSVSTIPPLPPVPGGSDGQIDDTIVVIEGAVSMYRNSPPQLQQSVLVTLRAALAAAIDTCDIALGNSPTQVGTASPAAASVPAVLPTQPAQPVVAPTSAGVSVQQTQSPSPLPQTQQQQQQGVKDPNTIVLDKIYDSVQAAHGDGKFGVRADITPEEASELAEQLIEMRTVLMEELDAGIPEPGSAPIRNKKQQSSDSSSSAPSPSSSVSKYQQMLAKAKAQKAAG